MDPFWAELYEGRHEWAMRAYEEFLDRIDPELSRDYRREGQVTCVVYGPTQVGKTTLLLNMLGIARPHLSDVAGVLRGGQGLAKSSTATPVRYRRSVDDRWRVGDPSRPYSDAECSEQLGRVRGAVEAGNYHSESVTDIHIPHDRFDSASDELDVRLLDLPGLDATNERERQYVMEVARRYVPLADLVVFVGRADALGFLHPHALEIEELRNWTSQPRRFRVVCTYSFSSASFVEWLDERTSAQDAKRKLFEQFNTHDFKLPCDVEKFVYPLEFGNSWLDLARSRPEYFTHARSIVDDLWRDFRAGIQSAANPYGRLHLAFELEDVVSKRKQIAKVNDSELVAAYRREVFQLRKARRAWQMRMRRAQAQVKATEDAISRLTTLSQDEIRAALVAAFPAPPAELELDQTTTTTLLEISGCYERQLQKAWLGFAWHPNPDVGRAAEWRLNASYVFPDFATFARKIAGYWTKRYRRNGSSWSSDVASLRSLMAQAHEKYVERACQVLADAAERERAKLRAQVPIYTARNRLLERGIQRSTQRIAERAGLQRDIASERRARAGRLEASVVEARAFQGLLRHSHAVRSAELSNAAQVEPDPVRLFYLLACDALHRPACDRLLDGIVT